MAAVNINSKNGSNHPSGIAVRRSRCHHKGGIYRHQHHPTLHPSGAFESMRLYYETELQIPNNVFALGAYSRDNDIIDIPAHSSHVIILTEYIALNKYSSTKWSCTYLGCSQAYTSIRVGWQIERASSKRRRRNIYQNSLFSVLSVGVALFATTFGTQSRTSRSCTQQKVCHL